MSKGAFYKLRWQIVQNVPLRLTSEYGFSKYSGKVVNAGRNRPPFAIQAQCGLFGTSMSRAGTVKPPVLRLRLLQP